MLSMQLLERDRIPTPHQYPVEHRQGEPVSNVAILYPGQDIQEPGMFDGISGYSAGQEVLRRADDFLKSEFGYKISEIARKDVDPKLLKQTQYTQPAVFILSIGIHNVNKHHLRKDGYLTLPRYVAGNSSGQSTAVTLSGALSFEEGLWASAMRGKVMQEHGDITPTSMVVVVTTEEVVKEILREYPLLDLCLINSDSKFVIGGPKDSLESAVRELAMRRVTVKPVPTDRAMHGRYVRPAKAEFSKALRQLDFQHPLIPLVGIHREHPLTDPEELIEELEYAFDNTFDNRKPLRFFDEAGIQVISEVDKRGIFSRVMENTFNAIATHRLEAAAIGAGTAAAAGVGIYEVWTRHHQQHPDNNVK